MMQFFLIKSNKIILIEVIAIKSVSRSDVFGKFEVLILPDQAKSNGN
jgi:hypothetical protein